MDTPENYYAILGVPSDADSDTIKRAYRQLARRYHPDLAGPKGAVQMKWINRAYDVLSDTEKRLKYDAILSGSIDLRGGGLTRPRPAARKLSKEEESTFAGLSIFSTGGPLRVGAKLHSELGVISALNSWETPDGLWIVAGSLDGQGLCWQPGARCDPVRFSIGETHTIESLRALRFSEQGNLLSGWGRLRLYVWRVSDGALLWSYPVEQRAVSAHYSLDVVLREAKASGPEVWMALPLLLQDPLAPRAQGVRGTDVVVHTLSSPADSLSLPLVCVEDELEKRRFWAIRLRALSQDASTLLTLSCANVPEASEQMIVLRRWDLTSKTRFRSKLRPQISIAITAGLCSECAPPYVLTADTRTLAFVHADRAVRLHDTFAGTYSELASGPMGASSRLAISPTGQRVAIAREDSEVNEGVIDLWQAGKGQIIQKLYHPWQVCALHFAGENLIAALTDGTIQIWKP